MEITLGNRFSLKKQIGSGSFGEIFQGFDLQTNHHVAIKLEKARNSSDKTGHQHSRQLLKDEAEIYKILDGMVGVPHAIAYGTQSYYNILVIDLLDKSLEDLLKKCNGHFSLKTVLMLADQMLLCLEGMHRNYLIHRDLKPENFMMGFGPQFYHNHQHKSNNDADNGNNNNGHSSLNEEGLFLPNNSNVHFEFFQNCQKQSGQDIQENLQNLNFLFSQAHNSRQNISIFRSNSLYIIDFGLSKYYYDVKQGTHTPLIEHPNMTGTARYASVSALHGLEQSRRDDLESLGYILIYFLKGKLPWQGLPGKNRKEKLNNILNTKAGISVEDLCEGVPSEFADFLSRVKKLHFTEEPHYSQYREMFRELFIREGFIYDYKYDWLEESPIDEEKRFRICSTSRFNSPNYFNYSNGSVLSQTNDHDIFNSRIRQTRSSFLNSTGNGIIRNRNHFTNDIAKKIPKNHSQMEISNINFISSFEKEHQQSIYQNQQHIHTEQEHQQSIYQNQQHIHTEQEHQEHQQHPQQHHQSLQELIYVPQNQQNQQHNKQNIIAPQNHKKDQQHRYSEIVSKLNPNSSSFLFPSFNDTTPEIMKNNGKTNPLSRSQTLNKPVLRNPSPSQIDRYVPYNNNVHLMKIPTPSIHKSPVPMQPPKAKPNSPVKSQIAKPINVSRFVLDNQK